MRDAQNRRTGAVRIGACYDLAVAPAFAVPWTAEAVLDGTRALHRMLGLPGQGPAEFGAEQLLFVNFFGVVVTLWAVVRLLRSDDVLLGAADTAGRAAFALVMVYALATGATPQLAGFLVIEVGFLAAQVRELSTRRRVPVREGEVR